MLTKRTSTWAEVDLNKLENNIEEIKKTLKPRTKICGVVKANAYGHGSVGIARFLQFKGVDYLSVARIEEALEIRESGIYIPILVMGYIKSFSTSKIDNEQNNFSMEDAVKNNIDVCIYSIESAKELDYICESLNKIAKVHIKIDTGMNRIGFKSEEALESIKYIASLKNIKIEGIFTHFATADEKNKEFTLKQKNIFDNLIRDLNSVNINIPIKHIANSAGIIDIGDLNYDMVRCGIIMYGCYPSDEVNISKINIRPILTLKTTVAHIKTISIGEGVSYGLKFKASKETRIATITIGYADGFFRIQTNPKVSINGKLYNVVGRICMDQCMVEIDDDSDIKVGDEVVVFGDIKDSTVQNLADDINTINYEVLCAISPRVNREYIYRDNIF